MDAAIDKSKAEAFIKKLRNKFFFRFFLWIKLPSAFRSGVQLESIDFSQATASVPFKRFTQNPFRSTYFACLAMAAELSTGILSIVAVQTSVKKISMLIVKMEAEYFKKATTTTYFTCSDGEKIMLALEQAISTGEPVVIKCESSGKNSAGDLIARFYFTWSFKLKEISK